MLEFHKYQSCSYRGGFAYPSAHSGRSSVTLDLMEKKEMVETIFMLFWEQEKRKMEF
jgi:hypothetical protein